MPRPASAGRPDLILAAQNQAILLRVRVATNQLSRANPFLVRQALQHPDPVYRFAAARTIGNRRLPGFDHDLVDLLSDLDEYVVQAARQSLMRLHGKDFGPLPCVGGDALRTSIAEWQKAVGYTPSPGNNSDDPFK